MGEIEGVIAVIDVAEWPDLGLEVAARSGISHESPQVIILHLGEPVWTAHHREISAEAISRAMAALG